MNNKTVVHINNEILGKIIRNKGTQTQKKVIQA